MKKLPRCCCSRCRTGTNPSEQKLHAQFKTLLDRLDERERRLMAAWQAEHFGYGGTSLVAQISGLSERTIRRGRREMADSLDRLPPGRCRAKGAGRKPNEKKESQSKFSCSS